MISELVARHPRLEIELKLSDREVDLLAERLDMAVRIREMRDSTLKARRLGDLRAVVFGSPSYFQRRGRPKHPDELAGHDCVVRLTDGDAEAWPFRIAGRHRRVKVSGRVRTDSTAAANAAVACGAGIGFAPLWLVRSLVEVARVPIHAVWLPTRVPLAKAQLFAEAMIARLRRERL